MFLGGLAALFLVARLCASLPCKSVKQLPFIADITHGICPRCGDSHPRKEVLAEDHELFWSAFKCYGCGFTVRLHMN
jgi:hypothetical protein